VIDDGQNNRIRFYCEGDEIRRPNEWTTMRSGRNGLAGVWGIFGTDIGC
jgi:hypothetical protein